MPVPVVKTPTGRYFVLVQAPAVAAGVAVYARVSSAVQRPDLDRQVARLTQWATGNGLTVGRVARVARMESRPVVPQLENLREPRMRPHLQRSHPRRTDMDLHRMRHHTRP
jgi:predicted site-specific integrase-resolvase